MLQRSATLNYLRLPWQRSREKETMKGSKMENRNMALNCLFSHPQLQITPKYVAIFHLRARFCLVKCLKRRQAKSSALAILVPLEGESCTCVMGGKWSKFHWVNIILCQAGEPHKTHEERSCLRLPAGRNGHHVCFGYAQMLIFQRSYRPRVHVACWRAEPLFSYRALGQCFST